MPFKFQHLGKSHSQTKKNPDSYKLHADEVVMTATMLLVMFGPKKLRPWLRHFITLLGIAGTVMGFLRRS